MKEHPILFSSEMVRAILDGRKTQTRRIIKMPEGIAEKYEYRGDDGGNELLPKESGHYWINGYAMWRPNLKYQVGDRLWVRETFRYVRVGLGCGGSAVGVEYKTGDIKFNKRANKYTKQARNKEKRGHHAKWRPSIHMPRWAARIFLEITNIRVERVQDISLKEVISEGIKDTNKCVYNDDNVFKCNHHDTLDKFKNLWDSLNAKRGYGWDKNPWCWVIEFKRKEKP